MTQTIQPEPVAREKVGGKLLSFSAAFTRPADTTAYTAGDVVSSSTTATVLMKFGADTTKIGGDQWPAAAPGGSVFLVKAILETDKATETAQYDLVLYNASEASVTVPADNAADTSLWDNRSYDLGTISFPAVAGATGTNTAAKALWSGTPLALTTLFPDRAIYGKLVNKTGTTPASGQNFYVRLTFLVN